jgi:hypothetical protein
MDEGPDGSRWMLEDANPGALFHVTPKAITSSQVPSLGRTVILRRSRENLSPVR